MHILQDFAVNDCDIIPRCMRYLQGERGSHPRTLAICCTKVRPQSVTACDSGIQPCAIRTFWVSCVR